MNKLVLVILSPLVVLVVSCNRSSIVGKDSVELLAPAISFDLSRDETFDGASMKLVGSESVQIVQDTLIVIQSQISDVSPKFFQVYSAINKHCRGSYVFRGRGPDELLQPYITRTNSSLPVLNVYDMASGSAYKIDVTGAQEKGHNAIMQKITLPDNTIDWIPLSDNLSFTLTILRNELTGMCINQNGSISQEYKLFPKIDAINHITRLSSILVSNNTTGQIAIFMVCFPHVIIIDPEKEKINSYAVDKSFRKWSTVLDSPFGPESIQYYSDATTSSDFIFAAYSGDSVRETNNAAHGTTIHVFDWAGNLLGAIKLRENLIRMSYDARSQHLYCIEQKGDLIRYDMSDILAGIMSKRYYR